MAVDAGNVCCMCGDIGFSNKLFQCLRCLYRFQHSYCSNYYHDQPAAGICDWCLSDEQRGSNPRVRQTAGGRLSAGDRSAASRQSGEREVVDAAAGSRGRTGGASSASPSSGKHAGRRYKLLKDVLC
ncbi:hypothetical protein AXF42_Ash018052 [Apostasia shenzhenica]|uniref:PHD-type zinc finger plants domain-containing protein n=1 Tax=Apostasia shenzhenica TaxID=1088818 RepID=A0A2I0AVL0_9ASPA|nr:hypothetical protein AXF42_Ash018052 [Apostasia shenzhenica]